MWKVYLTADDSGRGARRIHPRLIGRRKLLPPGEAAGRASSGDAREGAALGAAIQAAYAQAGGKISYGKLCARLVELDESTRCTPDTENAALYAKQLDRQMELTGRLQQTGWL